MSTYFTGTSSTYKNNYQHFGTCIQVPKKHHPSPWTPKFNNLRWRLQVHVQILDQTTPSTQGQTKDDHFIPPPRGWTSQMDNSHNCPNYMGDHMPRPIGLG